ncbi:hypothetical protein [Erythrobacter sp. WG]|uniref:hypothetical protein n=1 Tax=Erythrobacter sp. WG TaxID=2985510 RepID=UPI00226F7288|nr:hypothetical protein [Erythrobacter sp. WG]MCX9148596.1 hypothetical protein [Erythrobacter sp. WG]
MLPALVRAADLHVPGQHRIGRRQHRAQQQRARHGFVRATGRANCAPDSAVTRVELVTRFSHEYDFRNKRLPVWRAG